MKIKLISALIILFVASSMVIADDDPETPWPVEERCISQPTQPPDDWTYSGTLLMSGYAGIHAMQADWETLRVVAFFYADHLGSPIDGGQLSPDGKWYGVPIGTIITERSYNRFWIIEALRVYSLVDDTVLTFRITDYADDLGYRYYNCCAWDHDIVQWIDTGTLVMGGLLFHLSTGNVSLAPFLAGKDYYALLTFSPDIQRVFGWFQSDPAFIGVYDPYSHEKLLSSLDLVNGIAWRYSSDGFIAEHRIDTYADDVADYLSIYSRDGEFIETLFDQKIGSLNIQRSISGRSELGWSLDDTYFAFVYHPSISEAGRLLLLDTENRVILDTCLNPVSQPVWSPDGKQVAMLLNAPENLRVVILDLETWMAYNVARHSGRRGALVPDMIAWRADD